MSLYGKKPPLPSWKPDLCGCGSPHPGFSHNGREGPWLCRACFALPHEKPDPLMPSRPAAGSRQGSLL